ncbi:MAG: CbiX/SirB N-terminal domain-containing protein [Deltaproteobacteria bacterium]|nr:CbiX/SirB N-terminal domain-containing protein [Deltaproteobacteria bacterium]
MNCLLLVAHGSKRPESNEEVRQLIERIRAEVKNRFDVVELSFLEISQPSLSTAIDYLAKNQAKQIIVFPYFLAPGKHVAQDIPSILSSKQTQYPEVKIAMTPHLGCAKELTSLVVEIASNYLTSNAIKRIK